MEQFGFALSHFVTKVGSGAVGIQLFPGSLRFGQRISFKSCLRDLPSRA